MTDYILIKLTESALRAIDRPRRGLWVYRSSYLNGSCLHYDTHPIQQLVQDHYTDLLFPPGTSIMHTDGKVNKSHSPIRIRCYVHGSI